MPNHTLTYIILCCAGEDSANTFWKSWLVNNENIFRNKHNNLLYMYSVYRTQNVEVNNLNNKICASSFSRDIHTYIYIRTFLHPFHKHFYNLSLLFSYTRVSHIIRTYSIVLSTNIMWILRSHTCMENMYIFWHQIHQVASRRAYTLKCSTKLSFCHVYCVNIFAVKNIFGNISRQSLHIQI